jgi:hypothetical protein
MCSDMQLFICDEAVSASLLYSVKLTVKSNISAYLPSNHIICRRIRFRLTVHFIFKVTSVSSVIIAVRLLIEFVDKLYCAIKPSSLCSSSCFLFGTGAALHVICLQSVVVVEPHGWGNRVDSIPARNWRPLLVRQNAYEPARCRKQTGCLYRDVMWQSLSLH